ncbi:MAG TPA: ATP-binding protein [Anaerolineales bacterium]|nr:ATP-binding protein [Anaerolineales bacterium]
MPGDALAILQKDRFDPIEAPEPNANEGETQTGDLELSSTEEVAQSSLLHGVLGHVNFDGGAADNTTSQAMASADHRKGFRREVYVGIKDTEQNIEFLGRIVEGPFHIPHKSGSDPAKTKTTSAHPKRTKSRPSYDVYGNIEILGQLLDGEHVLPTPTRPRPYSEITVFPPERLRKLLDLEGNMLLGSLMGYEEQRIEVRVHTENKNILPLNVGIFGTVGSGKSNTVQVLVEEASSAGWACVVIDVEGEYVRMDEADDRPDMNRILRENYSIAPEGIKDFRVYVPSSGASDADQPSRFKVPISELDISIISDILEFSEPEFRMYERAVEATQRSNLPNHSSRLGTVAGEPTQASSYPFTLADLIDVLTNSAFYIRLNDVEKSTANTLRNKLFYTLGRSGMLDWTATESTPYLPVNELLVGGRVSVLDVSETDDRSRNIAIAYILESLFSKVTETAVGEMMPDTDVPRPKILLVIEEVHTFVSKQSVDKMKSVLDSLQTISRRGRKRWLSLALVSQQPGHVPEELFELANTRFIHQLKSAMNIAPVRQTTGGVHEALWSIIPALGPGQCLLTGRTFRNPLLMNVRPAKSKRLLTT